MSSLIDKGKVADKISDLFSDNYPNPSEELETFYKEVLKIVVNEEPQNQWVNVKDRLPEPFTVVLARYTDGGIRKVAYNNEFVGFITNATVTHWMPLPELPESEGDKEKAYEE